MKSVYFYLFFIFVSLMIIVIPKASYAVDLSDSYRFEHNGCIFSYVFPSSPSVSPIWMGEEAGVYEQFIRALPLVKNEILQGVKAEYKKHDLDSVNRIFIQTYCVKFEMPYEDNVLLAEDMLGLLRDSISSLDPFPVRSALSQEEIAFSRQENGIRWMRIRANVQQTMDGEVQTISHYRDVFAYKDQALLTMISFTDMDSTNKEAVDELFQSLILAE